MARVPQTVRITGRAAVQAAVVRSAIAMPMQWAVKAAMVRAWKTSCEPNQRGFGSGRLIP
jgi:hypothetical protein